MKASKLLTYLGLGLAGALSENGFYRLNCDAVTFNLDGKETTVRFYKK